MADRHCAFAVADGIVGIQQVERPQVGALFLKDDVVKPGGAGGAFPDVQGDIRSGGVFRHPDRVGNELPVAGSGDAFQVASGQEGFFAVFAGLGEFQRDGRAAPLRRGGDVFRFDPRAETVKRAGRQDRRGRNDGVFLRVCPMVLQGMGGAPPRPFFDDGAGAQAPARAVVFKAGVFERKRFDAVGLFVEAGIAVQIVRRVNSGGAKEEERE